MEVTPVQSQPLSATDVVIDKPVLPALPVDEQSTPIKQILPVSNGGVSSSSPMSPPIVTKEYVYSVKFVDNNGESFTATYHCLR